MCEISGEPFLSSRSQREYISEDFNLSQTFSVDSEGTHYKTARNSNMTSTSVSVHETEPPGKGLRTGSDLTCPPRPATVPPDRRDKRSQNFNSDEKGITYSSGETGKIYERENLNIHSRDCGPRNFTQTGEF